MSDNVTYIFSSSRGAPRGVADNQIGPESWENMHEHVADRGLAANPFKEPAVNPEDFVTPEAKYAAKMDEASAVSGPQEGMAPYPLYGIPGIGQAPETEVAVPFYRKPWFCYSVGGAIGFGAAWAFFEWFRPKYMKRPTRRNTKGSEK